MEHTITMLEHLLQSILQQVQQPKEDLEKNLRALLSEAVSRMDLVSREEFVRQEILLQDAKKTISELSSNIDQLKLHIESLQ